MVADPPGCRGWAQGTFLIVDDIDARAQLVRRGAEVTDGHIDGNL